MEKLSRTSYYYYFIMFLLAVKVTGRPLVYDSSDPISDGIDQVQPNISSVFLVKEVVDSSEELCEQMYGFLPCSYTALGHLFLIVVYEYLLFHGESYVACGGERIFKILGPGIFGASAFHVLGFLPEALILLGYGITADLETSYTARIMVLSVIPFIIIQIPTVFGFSSSWENIVIIITLVISVLFLLVYFIYQMFQPWIQKRRLEYVKHEHLVVDILRHIQKHAVGRLIDEDGSPNVPAIRRLFEEVDQDGDDIISFAELRKLLHQIKYKRWHADKDTAVAEVMKEFDLDGDHKITIDEFVNGITKWLDETKQTMDKQYHSVKSLKDLYKILQPWIRKKRKEHELHKQLIPEILGHVQGIAMGSLYMEDGRPNIPIIRRLFEDIDLDKDNCISQSELKELVVDIQFHNIPLDADEAVEQIMEELDISGDQMINEEEFVTGISKWLKISNQHAPNSTESEDEIYQKKWEEADLLVEERHVDRSALAWFKAIMLLVVGIAILGILAEPLIYSVQNFSQSASVPSFFISFILVPFATNARGAISAITAASRKKSRTTSLTFSEVCSFPWYFHLGCSLDHGFEEGFLGVSMNYTKESSQQISHFNLVSYVNLFANPQSKHRKVQAERKFVFSAKQKFLDPFAGETLSIEMVLYTMTNVCSISNLSKLSPK